MADLRGGHGADHPAGLTHFNIVSSPQFAAATLAFLDNQPG